MSTEKLFKVEELHRGKWQPLMSDKDKQKVAKITEEEAEIMNGQSKYSNMRYVLDSDKNEDNDSEDTNELDALRQEYLEVVGEKAHHLKGAEKLKAEIAEAKK